MRPPRPAEMPADTAIAHVAQRVPVAGPDERVADAIARLRGEGFDTVDELAVLDDGAFVGLIPFERLLAASDGDPLKDLIEDETPTVLPHDDETEAARLAVAHRHRSLAVIDEQGRFLGLIPPERMLAVLVAQHEKDLARIGGYVAGSDQARSAAEEGVGQRLRHRLPWLLVGLVGAMGSAVLVGAFDERLDANVLIALFIPAIVYMAGAVGAQTVTVLVRGMAVGVKARDTIRRELISGLVTGAAIGGTFFVFALIGWGDSEVALAVGLALLASCSTATVVALALPAGFERLGIDPAFGSGPLVTVIQDLLSIAVYFAIVVAIAS